MPEISIITINYNNHEGLKKTMENVFEQNFTNYEYIIIDGGSDDGSPNIIEEHKDKLSYWVSEKDRGIYHAMNKGIVKANGEYLIFLNSGDYFYSRKSLMKLIENNHGEDIIYGNKLMKSINGNEWIFKTPDELTFGYLLKSSLPHQAALIKKTLFDKTGLYNENYKIISDWEFFIKAICVFNCSYLYVKEIIAVFNMEGISAQFENKELIAKERNQVLHEHYSTYLKEYAEYFENKAELNNYKNSRAHQFVDKIIKSPLYKKFKK